MKNYHWKMPILGACVFLSEAAVQTMYGDVQIHDAIIQSELKIIGRGSILRSVFEAGLKVVGVLKAEQATFNKSLYVTGSDLWLRSSQILGDVHVTNYISRPRIHLSGTTIHGRVIFHSLVSGEVSKDGSSQIQGGIENGEIQNA